MMATISRIIRLNPLRGCLTNYTRCLATNTTRNPSPPLVPQIALTNNFWIWQKNDKLKLPILNIIPSIDLPNGANWISPPPLEEPKTSEELEMPSTVESGISKQAERLIVIRRKKMKKHKLKKLRKRMKYEWAKRRQRRELKKEKEFQAVLIQQCKEAEAFSAEQYVNEKLAKFNQVLKAMEPKHIERKPV